MTHLVMSSGGGQGGGVGHDRIACHLLLKNVSLSSSVFGRFMLLCDEKCNSRH